MMHLTREQGRRLTDDAVVVAITMPVPPSVNNAYVNIPGRGRVPGKQLRQWKELAGWEVLQQRPKRVNGDVSIQIEVARFQSKSRNDIDNRIKAALDLLVSLGIIEDDSRVVKVSAEWTHRKDAPPCRVVVTKAYLESLTKGLEMDWQPIENFKPEMFPDCEFFMVWMSHPEHGEWPEQAQWDRAHVETEEGYVPSGDFQITGPWRHTDEFEDLEPVAFARIVGPDLAALKKAA